MNTQYRKNLPGTSLDYFDAREAVEAIRPGAWAKLPYTSRVHAENLVRRCDPAILERSLRQIVEGKREHDFPWFPARVVCHDILGQTALVDLAGLRDAIAEQGGDPAQVNPVVPVQLIVDHSLAVECGGFDPDAFAKNRAIEDRRNEDRFHFIDWTKRAFRNVEVIPPGNGIMHQINLEKMSPVIQSQRDENGKFVAFPDTCVGTDSHTPHVDALGVIAIGVGGLEAENVMLGRASWMRLPDIIGVELTGKPQPGITATDIKVLDAKHGNWNRDDAFKVMQDFLTRFKQIDAVWASDDDMAVGVQKAIEQAKRSDVKMVLGGAGSKDYIKKVMDGDKMVTADVTYSPSMIADAMKLTAAARVKGEKLPASTIIPSVLVTKDNAKQYYFPDSPF